MYVTLLSTKAVLNVFYNKLCANVRFYYKHQKRKCAADMKFCDVMDLPWPPAANIKRLSLNIMSSDIEYMKQVDLLAYCTYLSN